MTRVVVDASVALKWFLPEESAREARRLLGGRAELAAPELLLAECANALRTQVAGGRLPPRRAVAILGALMRLPISLWPLAPLLPEAFEIACATSQSVYDSLYLALAIDRAAPMVTADRRLLAALAGGPLASHAVWVADLE